MKRFIYSIFAVLALSCTFVACGDDGDEQIAYSTTAEQATAGTYSGTWTRTGNDGEVTYSGSVTLAAGAAQNVSSVTFNCPEANLNATSVANVWNAGHNFQFMNQVASNNPSNGLGAAFAGYISQAGELTTSFTLSQRVGRQNLEFKYVFVGKK